MSIAGSYIRHVTNMRRRNDVANDLASAQRTTAELLREEREETEAALAEPPTPDAVPDGPRPTKRAQWDEKQACWVEWDKRTEAWVRVG